MNTFQQQQAAKMLACYITPEEIQKSLEDNDIEKAHPVGYINKNGYQKQADGKYKYVGKNKTTNTIESISPNSTSPEEVELGDVRYQLEILGAKRDLSATEERQEDRLIARERELENIVFKQKNFPEKEESSEVDTKATHTANKSFTLRNYNITLNGDNQYRGEVKVKKGDKLNINSQSGSLGDIYTVENLTTGETAKFWSYNYGLPDELKENVDKS